MQLRQADDESKLQAKPFPKPFISADVGARVHATASVAACVRVCTAVPGWVRLWMRAGVVACVRASVSACMGVAMLGCVGCAVAWVRACVRLFACAQRALLAPFSHFLAHSVAHRCTTLRCTCALMLQTARRVEELNTKMAHVMVITQ